MEDADEIGLVRQQDRIHGCPCMVNDLPFAFGREVVAQGAALPQGVIGTNVERIKHEAVASLAVLDGEECVVYRLLECIAVILIGNLACSNGVENNRCVRNVIANMVWFY